MLSSTTLPHEVSHMFRFFRSEGSHRCNRRAVSTSAAASLERDAHAGCACLASAALAEHPADSGNIFPQASSRESSGCDAADSLSEVLIGLILNIDLVNIERGVLTCVFSLQVQQVLSVPQLSES